MKESEVSRRESNIVQESNREYIHRIKEESIAFGSDVLSEEVTHTREQLPRHCQHLLIGFVINNTTARLASYLRNSIVTHNNLHTLLRIFLGAVEIIISNH